MIWIHTECGGRNIGAAGAVACTRCGEYPDQPSEVQEQPPYGGTVALHPADTDGGFETGVRVTPTAGDPRRPEGVPYAVLIAWPPGSPRPIREWLPPDALTWGADVTEAATAAARQRAAYHRGEVSRYLTTRHLAAPGTSWRPGEHDGITVSAEWLHAILIEHEATRS